MKLGRFILGIMIGVGLSTIPLIHASLTLPTALVETTTVGGTVTDNRNVAALRTNDVDYRSGRSTWIFCKGSGNGPAFVDGAISSCISATFNSATGAWSASNGTSGTLTAPQLTTFVNNEKAARNGIETLIGTQIYTGSTQVAN